MQPIKVAVIADDATGAADTGVQFARVAPPVYLAHADQLAGLAFPEPPGTLALHCDSRALDPALAARAAAGASRALAPHAPRLVYKKIDSCLRGNLGSELLAVMAELGLGPALVAPAYPALGRTTVHDLHFLNGVPVAQTEMARDPLTPVHESRLSLLLAEQTRQPVGRLRLDDYQGGDERLDQALLAQLDQGVRVLACDARSQDHLDRLAALALERHPRALLVGSAGLALGLAKALANGAPAPAVPPRLAGRFLWVCGSATDRLREQAARLEAQGIPGLIMEARLLADPGAGEARRELAARAAARLREGDLVLQVSPKKDPAPPGLLVAAGLAQVAAGVLALARPGGVFLSGGDTAREVFLRLGCRGLKVCDEPLPGLVRAAMLGGGQDGLLTVTKSGPSATPKPWWNSTGSCIPRKGRHHAPIAPPGHLHGDPGGIGPEIAAKTLAQSATFSLCRPLVVGDAGVMANAVRFCGLDLTVHAVATPGAGRYQPGTLDVLDLANLPLAELRHGQVRALQGKASFEYIVKNIELALAGQVDGTVTGPINKAAINAAGCHFAGHTEIYAHYTQTRDYAMMLCEGNFRVVHVSTHVSLREACDRVKTPRVLRVIELTQATLQKLGLAAPRIGVAGLNPHCGEGGLFGTEDDTEIAPAVAQAQAKGIAAEGPIPADTIFSKMQGGLYDAVVVMYHDQGHIPTKLVGFKFDARSGTWGAMAGVNVTLGLPIVRTSVDHGTAFDIAGQGKANPASMKAAILLAARMANMKAQKALPQDRPPV